MKRSAGEKPFDINQKASVRPVGLVSRNAMTQSEVPRQA